MKCPHCAHERNKVLETRGERRRHLCCGCGKKFTSVGDQVLVDLRGESMKNLWWHGCPPSERVQRASAPVVGVGPEGEVHRYPSVAAAARAHEIARSAIRAAMKRGGRSCGLRWQRDA